MADIRALLAAERQSRRISHPHLTYTKSGLLTCNVCNLNVKSEQLWEGHLRSANHKKSTRNAQENKIKGLKRKIEDVEEAPAEDRTYEVDGRKKPKPPSEIVTAVAEEDNNAIDSSTAIHDSKAETQVLKDEQPANVTPTILVTAAPVTLPRVDEDEWAAFERDIAPLKQPDYSAAVISAAPVSAGELAQQAELDRRNRRDTEADDEKEDEGRRLEDEFDVMEEMEAKVKRLREQRESLRLSSKAGNDAVEQIPPLSVLPTDEYDSSKEDTARTRPDEEDEEDDDEEDDWYS